MPIPVHIVIVTHNSAGVIDVCLNHLEKQTAPIKSVIIVDSGSDNAAYLDTDHRLPGRKIFKTGNIGFSQANNLGFKEAAADRDGLVIFMNPDTFLPSEYISQAIQVMHENPGAAVVSGKLLGFDATTMQPTGKIDSAGIFRKWYGRWYDRGQGDEDTGQFALIETLPAVCGALLCCRIKALEHFGGNVFDPDFFLYKEDIELGIRLRETGWKLIYDPRLFAYHCRGWGKRAETGYDLRLAAARSEVLLYRKHPGRFVVWAYFKLFLVRFFHV